ncbi:MAG: 30S ribosomal protein S3 [Candidatus Paceibacteria bacterium]
MGHKVRPNAYRLGISKPWRSRYLLKKDLPLALEEDHIIRQVINKKLAKMGVESIEIERTQDSIQILIKSARPGLIIGRGGTGIEDLRRVIMREVEKFRKKKNIESKYSIQLTVEEVKHPEISSKVVAENIAQELEKRTPFRRTIKQALSRIMQHKEVKGAKIMVSGRLDGAEIARTEWISEGKIPLVTIRSDIDYGEAEAHCTYGVVGVKVWIYRGEKLA